MTKLIARILDVNRNPELTPWFRKQLEHQLEAGLHQLDGEEILHPILASLQDYSEAHGIDTVVVGMSGGIDSAVTACVFQRAGFKVIPVIMPIHQNPVETELGHLACQAMEIEPVVIELTDQFDHMVKTLHHADLDLWDRRNYLSTIRRGNIRARLRMIALYNLAHVHGGIVGSTDNFSEMAAGFWTLHGDVGDVAPIQSLTKSWEVPLLADYLGVPEPIRKAVPTDGLGINKGDEDHLGFSYLEFDIGLFAMMHVTDIQKELSDATPQDCDLLDRIRKRISSTVFKRNSPVCLDHPAHATRYISLQQLDDLLGK